MPHRTRGSAHFLFIMSESEEPDILDDIHALEEALIIDAKGESQEQQYDRDDYAQFSDCTSALATKAADEDDYFDINQDIDTDRESLDAYEVNRRLIIGLTLAQKKLTGLLQEHQEKIKQLDEEIKCMDVSSLRIRCPINMVGMPYFKDKNNFSAPRNSDTKLKESRGELLLLSLKKPSRWSQKDRNILLEAVHNQAIESILYMNSKSDVDVGEESSKWKQDETKNIFKFMVPKSHNELVGALGEKKFDWYKISVMNFDSKHSAEECEAMWNVYLHPQIRKSGWTDVEDKRLLRCAKQYKFQDWDSITLKLGTNRSAYQCFIRHNTIKRVPSTGRSWSKAEDKHLVRTIDSLRIGNYIPWSEVANYLWHRTKQQIYTRWTYRKAPHLRKGRFTFVETETLLKAIQEHGKDFPKISNIVMPNRTSVQLSEHYYTLMKNQIGENKWTIDDDMRLIKLHKKWGNNWSEIATHFYHKTRTQVRHRFNSLVRYTKKGISIECIPRKEHFSSRKNKNKNISINNKLLSEYHDADTSTLEEIPVIITDITGIIDITDIQLRLYETFCFPPLRITDCKNEFFELEQLAFKTKELYNVLNLLGVNLDIPYDFLNYIHINRREKQLFISLKEYINERNNRIESDKTEIENLRLLMFGNNQNVSESSCFVPPIPFCGYTGKPRKVQNEIQQNIDYIIDFNNKILITTPTKFSETPATETFVTIEEINQFDKFSQLLTNSHYDYERKDINLRKLLEYSSSFDKRNMKRDMQIEQSNNLQETTKSSNKRNKKILSNVILPNRATLLGFKNLLLWKLLYEYQNKSSESSSLIDDQVLDQTLTTQPNQSNEYKEAYELLRTRLYQLFKFPISLSNTTLEICGSGTFLSEEADQQTSEKVSRKRKSERINPVQADKKVEINVLADSNFQKNTDIKVPNLCMIRSSKIISKKYKIIK